MARMLQSTAYNPSRQCHQCSSSPRTIDTHQRGSLFCLGLESLLHFVSSAINVALGIQRKLTWRKYVIFDDIEAFFTPYSMHTHCTLLCEFIVCCTGLAGPCLWIT
jgi:hypothetical protein